MYGFAGSQGPVDQFGRPHPNQSFDGPYGQRMVMGSHMGPDMHGNMMPPPNSGMMPYTDQSMMNQNSGMPPNTSVMPNNNMMPNAGMMGKHNVPNNQMMSRSMMPNSHDGMSSQSGYGQDSNMPNQPFPRPNMNAQMSGQYPSGGMTGNMPNSYPYNRPNMPEYQNMNQTSGMNQMSGMSQQGSFGDSSMNRMSGQSADQFNDPYRRGSMGQDGYTRMPQQMPTPGSQPGTSQAGPPQQQADNFNTANRYSGAPPQVMTSTSSGQPYPSFGPQLDRCVAFIFKDKSNYIVLVYIELVYISFSYVITLN